MTDDDLDGGPSDTDELPSPTGSMAPAIPGPPPLPTRTDHDPTTEPPGADDTGEWSDPLIDDPMRHAPAYIRSMSGRIDDVYGLIRALPALLRTESDRKIDGMLEKIERQFSVLIARDDTREKAIGALSEEVDEVKTMLEDVRKRLDAIDRRVSRLEPDGR